MAPFSLYKFISEQLTSLPDVDSIDLSGRNVIVTGSNIGLGLEAARHFANMKPQLLILAVRSLEKGEAAKKDILSTCPSGVNVQVWQLDLGSFASVKKFAERVKSELQRLDVLLLNAGIANDFWQTTSDGYEAVLQTNVISTGMLALLLLPLLESTAKEAAPASSPSFKPHLTLTGSEVHFWSKFKEAKNDQHPIHALNDKSKFDGNDRYNVSKLLNLFLVREIGQIATDKVVVNVVNPGLCHSSLTRDATGIKYYGIALLKALLARTTEAGSRNLVWASLNSTKPGAYSSACRVEEESDYSLSQEGMEAQKKSWADLKEIWIKQAPETKEVLA